MSLINGREHVCDYKMCHFVRNQQAPPECGEDMKCPEDIQKSFQQKREAEWAEINNRH